MNMQPSVCPLCNIEPAKEQVYYMNEKFLVVSTKDKKGHQERVMIVYYDHGKNIDPEDCDEAMFILDSVCPEIFDYTSKVVVMEGRYSELRDHWHLVVTDLEQGSEDHEQILGTPWLKVIHLTDWR